MLKTGTDLNTHAGTYTAVQFVVIFQAESRNSNIFQSSDAGMHINQGFFRTNGACGYVLKPPNLRKNSKFNLN